MHNEQNERSRQLLDVLTRSGPMAAPDLCRQLGISQAGLSRLVRSLPDQVLVAGKARSTRYAAARRLFDVPVPVPVYEVRSGSESPRHFVDLWPIHPRGYCVRWVDENRATFYEDLPWFLDGLRPSGFLGRLLARRQGGLGFPEDVRLWSGDQVLVFVFRSGADLVGAFVVGDGAYQRFLSHASAPVDVVDSGEKELRYLEIARDVLSFGNAGSSAAGEHPKFLATLRSGGQLTPVLVKFSPPVNDAASERVSDLLVCEHLALRVLVSLGFPSTESEILQAGNRTFLQVRRFDRQGLSHRVGQVALAALDAEFVGSDLRSWSASVALLVRKGVVPASELPRVQLQELFGLLIGNADQHFGNLALDLDGSTLTRVSPPYDMSPMYYYPRHGEHRDDPFPLSGLPPQFAAVAPTALDAAVHFWNEVASDSRISKSFQGIARDNAARVEAMRGQLDLLPR